MSRPIPFAVRYPTIEPLDATTPRPTWSVMLPTCNRIDYLETALRSVLEQDPGRDRMQIQVVDNCSSDCDVGRLVSRFAGTRVEFFRQAENQGMAANWNTCVRRARGEWVHILHDDDCVLPGFYDALMDSNGLAPEAGAAFCRHIEIDAAGRSSGVSELVQPHAGLVSDIERLLAVYNRIMCPAVLVKRDVYVSVGGFLQELVYTADWEMWRRIAAHAPIRYDPRPLACYRTHHGSETNKHYRSGKAFADARKCISLCRTYLPAETAKSWSRAGQWNHLRVAASTCYHSMFRGDFAAAAPQAVETFRSATALIGLL